MKTKKKMKQTEGNFLNILHILISSLDSRKITTTKEGKKNNFFTSRIL